MKEIKLIDQSINLFKNDYRNNDNKNKDLINNYVYLGYFINNQLVAFVSFIILGDNIDIDYIVVKEQFQNQNIGTILLRHIMNNYNFYKLTVEVNVKNHKAQNFYYKCGFKVVHKRLKYYGSDDALIMQYTRS